MVKKATKTMFKDLMVEKPNLDLLAQAIRVYENRLHTGRSKTKTRGEINLTTRKWYRQKGTGRARHGAQSAPIFVGGAKAHGPKGVKRVLKMPIKMRRQALKSAFSIKFAEDRISILEGVSTIDRTKKAAQALGREGKQGKMKITLALSEKNLEKKRFFQNIANLKIIAFKDLNAYDVFFAPRLLIDEDVFSKDEKTKNEEN